MIGEIQRNEVNSAFSFLPYDSVPDEPGIFVPAPIFAFSPFIYSTKHHNGDVIHLNILSLYTNFSSEEWTYWFTAFTLCSAILVSMHRRKRYRVRVNEMNSFLKYYWDFFMLTMDLAPTEISKLLSANVLWAFIVIGVYYGFHMIFMSTLSADLTVPQSDKWINNLKDLLYEKPFDSLTPTIISHLSMPQVLSRSENGSDERVLYDRIIANRNNSIVEFELTDLPKLMEKLFNMLYEMTSLKIAVIEDSMFMDTYVEHFLCHMIPYRAKLTVKSEENILGAPMAMLISQDTNQEVVKLFAYRSRNGAEFGIFKGVSQVKMPGAVTEISGIAKTIDGYQCADLLRGMIMESMDQGWQPLPISFFVWFILICCSIIVFSYFALKIEHLFKLITG